jgi:hypothetical protein
MPLQYELLNLFIKEKKTGENVRFMMMNFIMGGVWMCGNRITKNKE